ncbi:MAG: helix-turn-helix domain-containing protein [Tenuifilaceae bacterium]
MFNKEINNKINYNLTEFNILKLNCLDVGKLNDIVKEKWHTLIYITGGNGVLEIDFDEHLAIKNKFFFIEKFKKWSWIKLDEIEGVMVQFTDSFYNLIYTGNPKIKSDQSLIGELTPFIKIEEKNEDEWRNAFDIIMKEYSQLRDNSKEIICLTLKVLILMYRRKAFAKGTLFVADRKKQLLSDFRKLVNNKFSELKTPKEFALRLNITPNYLNALCKDIYNKTVTEIIQERVILESKRLLAHSGLSVSEISYKLGFKDNSYFGRYFKKVVGMPPEKYRTTNYVS